MHKHATPTQDNKQGRDSAAASKKKIGKGGTNRTGLALSFTP